MTETTPTRRLAPVVRAVHVRCSPQDAFRVFTDRIADWWPLQQFGTYQSKTEGVWFDGDRVVERSTSGEESVWAEVQEWAPPARVVLSWHPGRAATDATVVEVDFAADEDGTRVVLTHHGWERLGAQAEESRASYEGGWVEVIERFARFADDSGRP